MTSSFIFYMAEDISNLPLRVTVCSLNSYKQVSASIHSFIYSLMLCLHLSTAVRYIYHYQQADDRTIDTLWTGKSAPGQHKPPQWMVLPHDLLSLAIAYTANYHFAHYFAIIKYPRLWSRVHKKLRIASTEI